MRAYQRTAPGADDGLTLSHIVYTSCKVLLEFDPAKDRQLIDGVLHSTVITFRGDTYRIMSLRHASRRERRLYGEAFNE